MKKEEATIQEVKTVTNKVKNSKANLSSFLENRTFPNVKTGLTTEQVNDRLQYGLNNVNNVKTTKSIWKIIYGNCFTFFNFLYLIITVLLCLVNSWQNLTFLAVVIPNTVLAVFQEIKAKRTIERLNLVSESKATVIRDGLKVQTEIANVVLDDIIVFNTGNQISTDSIVKEGFVEVNESMITGEADAITKQLGDMLYSGSYIVSGSCRAQVEHVGKDNYIEKLAMEAKKQKANKSELLGTLNWIIKVIGFLIIPLGAFSFYQAFTKPLDPDNRFAEAIVAVAGSVIGMIPSGLFLLTTLALSAGVSRLGRRHRTSVKQLYCIEMLARTDILCLDKTGTITDGTMRVIDCIEMKNTTDYNLKQIVGSMMNAFEEKNATSEALIRFFGIDKSLSAVKTIPFSSQRKYSGVSFKQGGTFFLGAPEYILKDASDKIMAQINRFAAQGCRVIAVAYNNSQPKENEIPRGTKPLALIVIQDHIREDAYETIEYFRNNGVDVKVISGDNPVTVAEIASRAGIAKANKYISLEGLTDEEVKEIAFEYTIFGRVSPTQKRALVEAYKAENKTVAMTGDGVNDILALKESDCSIAMASGSEATRNIANIVLVDSNFSAMPYVVAEGRRVINNIQRTSTLFLVKTIFTILLTIFYIFMAQLYLFEPSQLFWIELVIIGLPAIIISLQPNHEKVTGKFISNVLRSSLPGALTVLFFHMGLNVIGNNITELGWFVEDSNLGTMVSTPTFISMALLITMSICVVVLYKMCRPFNLLKVLVFTTVVLATIAIVFLCGTDNFLGRFINGFLKIEWPLGSYPSDGTEAVTNGLANNLMLVLLILLIGPVMNLFEKILGRVQKVKI